MGFGPGSSATTFTVTPTYQKAGFYFRADFAVVHATDYIPGIVFGPAGTDATQFRAVGEFGFIFETTDGYEALAPGASTPLSKKPR